MAANLDGLRAEVRTCCNIDEIMTWLLDHAKELSLICGATDYPIMVSPSHLNTINPFLAADMFFQYNDKPIWAFELWLLGDGVFCDSFIQHVLPALGFTVTWMFQRQLHPRHGCDIGIVIEKHEWPIMEYCERLSR